MSLQLRLDITIPKRNNILLLVRSSQIVRLAWKIEDDLLGSVFDTACDCRATIGTNVDR